MVLASTASDGVRAKHREVASICALSTSHTQTPTRNHLYRRHRLPHAGTHRSRIAARFAYIHRSNTEGTGKLPWIVNHVVHQSISTNKLPWSLTCKLDAAWLRLSRQMSQLVCIPARR
jgi:hypothetical protein